LDSALEFGQILVDGGLHDRVCGIEVAVGEVVAHAAICRHGIDGWGASRSSGSALSASPVSSRRMRTASKISLRQVATLRARADRVDRSLDIGQPLVLPVAHSAIRSGSIRSRTPGLRSAAGIRSTRGAEDGFQVGLEAAQAEEAQPGREVGEQVHVTIGAVSAAGHAAEHAQVADAVGCCSSDQVLAVAADAAAHWA
jgi:hypothetical protein